MVHHNKTIANPTERTLPTKQLLTGFTNFVRCQRADGSFYGTSGKCRKGREVDSKQYPLKNLDLTLKRLPKPEAKVLGEGGYGKAFDLGGGVVLKKGKFFASEIKAMQDLKNIKGIPKLLAYKFTEKKLIGRQTDRMRHGVIAMSKAPGKPLVDFEGNLSVWRRSWEKILPLLKKIHEANYSHGDLHEENIFYNPATKTATIIDFGAAVKNNTKFQIDDIKTVFNTIDFYNDGETPMSKREFPVTTAFMEKAQVLLKTPDSEQVGKKGKRLLEEIWSGIPDAQ